MIQRPDLNYNLIQLLGILSIGYMHDPMAKFH